MRKKGDRVIDGKLVRFEEVSTTTVGVEISATNDNKYIVTSSSSGNELASAIKDTDEMKLNEQSVIINIKDGRIETTMTGYWDGRLLSAAMRSIERKYDDIRKQAAMWAMKQSQNNSTEILEKV